MGQPQMCMLRVKHAVLLYDLAIYRGKNTTQALYAMLRP
jgi:hypothetical protein